MIAGGSPTQSSQLATLLAGVAPPHNLNLAIADLSLDSRKVVPGGLFLAIPGSRGHGSEHIDDAIARGACAVLVDQPGSSELSWRQNVPLLPVDQLAARASLIASRFFGEPSAALWVAGITGTNGKTSCAWWLQQLLNFGGIAAASLGTLGVVRGSTARTGGPGLTTADAVDLQRELKFLLEEGVEAVAMEVSSHGLVQHRVEAVQFDLAIFTNLTQDHLDYHGDLQSYAGAKRRLFEFPGLSQCLINLDDEMGRQLVATLPSSLQIYTFSLQDNSADFYALTDREGAGLSAEIDTPWGSFSLRHERIFGRHNLANLICISAAAAIKGMELETIAERISELSPVPGRLELLSEPDDDIRVFVDYAHTPDAVAKTLHSLRPTTTGKLHAVLGAGGDRDRAKRPLMARAALDNADFLTITSDNPRSEDPATIARDMQAGLRASDRVEVILDRQQAIDSAIYRAAPGDCLAILGKGHENFQLIGDQRLPFSDAVTGRTALQSRREAQR